MSLLVRCRCRLWSRLAAGVVATALCSPAARAEPTIWQRARAAPRAEEHATLRAVERVLSGRGEELDLLLVRTAIVELMRHRVRDPRTVVLLFHLRRELGLSPPAGGIARLSGALSPSLSKWDLALGYFERARLRLDTFFGRDESTPAADTESLAAGWLDIERALRFAWLPEQRAEIFAYRGMAALLLQRYGQARSDFLRVIELDDASLRLRDSYLALGFLGILRGDLASADRYFDAVNDLERRGGPTNHVEPFSSFPLPPAARRSFELSVRAARAGRPQNGEMDPEICALFRADETEQVAPFSSLDRAWLLYCRAPGKQEPGRAHVDGSDIDEGGAIDSPND